MAPGQGLILFVHSRATSPFATALCGDRDGSFSVALGKLKPKLCMRHGAI